MTATSRLTGRKFDTCTITASQVSAGQIRWRSAASGRRAQRLQSRKLGITRIACLMPNVLMVSASRLCDTAVTPWDCSIEKPTTRAYDGSLPTSVMSVPWSVVTVRGAGAPGTDVSI